MRRDHQILREMQLPNPQSQSCKRHINHTWKRLDDDPSPDLEGKKALLVNKGCNHVPCPREVRTEWTSESSEAALGRLDNTEIQTNVPGILDNEAVPAPESGHRFAKDFDGGQHIGMRKLLFCTFLT